MSLLRTLSAEDILRQGRGVQASLPEAVIRESEKIIHAVRTGGDEALKSYAGKFDQWNAAEPLVFSRQDLAPSVREISREQLNLLKRTLARIEKFARAQRKCLKDLRLKSPGGVMGHTFTPVESAGCYAPGGRYSLPSSVLMTVATARCAGVKRICVASPKPSAVTKAAAYLAGAHALLAAGGAQAIGALAYGTQSVPACDVIVGPGNVWVTAAKRIVSADVGIDFLAGPTEVVIVADRYSDCKLIAADLLAQAEHDPESKPILVSLNSAVIEKVNLALAEKLLNLPSRVIAEQALANGYAVYARDKKELLAICDLLTPEHLQLHIRNAKKLAGAFQNYGALFIGENTTAVLGDYGAGPNHVLPTAGGARYSGGLSVANFLKMQTYLQMGEMNGAARKIAQDAVDFARLEGLEAHARAVHRRIRR